MLTDFHNHFLPHIDDGAETAAVSARICDYSWAQGIKRIIATPHFYPEKESVKDFLRRRSNAYSSYRKYASAFASLTIQLGAEIALSEGISLIDNFDKLTIARSPYIFIELPVFQFDKWIFSELNCILYRHKFIPIFSNIERYQIAYPSEAFESLLKTPKAIFQINTRSLLNQKTGLIIKDLLRKNRMVLFGSNAHNMNSRAPEWSVARERLISLLGNTQYNILVLQNNAFLNPKMAKK